MQGGWSRNIKKQKNIKKLPSIHQGQPFGVSSFAHPCWKEKCQWHGNDMIVLHVGNTFARVLVNETSACLPRVPHNVLYNCQQPEQSPLNGKSLTCLSIINHYIIGHESRNFDHVSVTVPLQDTVWLARILCDFTLHHVSRLSFRSLPRVVWKINKNHEHHHRAVASFFCFSSSLARLTILKHYQPFGSEVSSWIDLKPVNVLTKSATKCHQGNQ